MCMFGVMGVWCVSVFKMVIWSFGGGNGTYKSLFKRSGRSIVGLIMLGWFVVVIKNVVFCVLRLFILVRSWFMMCLVEVLSSSFSRRGVREFISLKNNTYGFVFCVCWNSVCIVCLFLLMYLFNNFGFLMDMKFVIVLFVVVLAMSVLSYFGGS